MHIFDFRWDDKTQKPYFEYCKKDELHKYFLSFDESFSLSITNENLECVGSKKSGVYAKCPTNELGIKKCERCKKIEDYFPCQFCNGFNCDRFREQKIENCDADHMVYLALFSKDVVKVGVSRMSRMKSRQFEQGSHYTQVFAEGLTGIMARRVETFLGTLGFPDKVPASQKKDILFPQVPVEEGKKILQEKKEFAKESLHHHMPEVMQNVVENTFWDMRPHYAVNFDQLELSHKPVHMVSLEENESISGVLKGVKGSFLLIETETELVTFLAKECVGKKISFAPCAKGITKNGGFQGGLF